MVSGAAAHPRLAPRPHRRGGSMSKRMATQEEIHERPVWILRDAAGILSMAATEGGLYDGFINGQRSPSYQTPSRSGSPGGRPRGAKR